MRAGFVIIVLIVSSLCFPIVAAADGDYVNSELPWHPLTVDSQDRLLAWYHPGQNLGYDKVLHLAWDFLENKVPDDPKSGLKIYLINSAFDAGTLQGVNSQGNPASMFGQFV